MFSIRAYGVYAILVWSIIMGFAMDILWRCWFLCCSPVGRHRKNGYAVADEHDLALAGPEDDDDDDDGDDDDEIIIHARKEKRLV